MHNVQYSQAMLERGVCELAHFFFYLRKRDCMYVPLNLLNTSSCRRADAHYTTVFRVGARYTILVRADRQILTEAG